VFFLFWRRRMERQKIFSFSLSVFQNYLQPSLLLVPLFLSTQSFPAACLSIASSSSLTTANPQSVQYGTTQQEIQGEMEVKQKRIQRVQV
jgi:hypothetical protein